jgi:hypothetical protein
MISAGADRGVPTSSSSSNQHARGAVPLWATYAAASRATPGERREVDQRLHGASVPP